jgi:hypothetical protein
MKRNILGVSGKLFLLSKGEKHRDRTLFLLLLDIIVSE